MIAVDTSILVRLLTKDNLSKAKRTAKKMESNDILIPKPLCWRQNGYYGMPNLTYIDI